ATRTHGARHVEVERGLLRPAKVLHGVIALRAILVELLETAIRGGAGRQAELRAVNAQIPLRIRVAIGVHDRDEGGRVAGAVDVIGIAQIGGRVAPYGRILGGV